MLRERLRTQSWGARQGGFWGRGWGILGMHSKKAGGVDAPDHGAADDGGICVDRAGLDGGLPRPDAHGAVIIPAHNEADVIARTLTALVPLVTGTAIEVIVVANGCRDDTAIVARAFAGVTVVELERGSKTLALNAGDAIARSWPRLYLDADIEIEPVAVFALFDAFEDPAVLAARTRYSYDISGATWPVRAYYRARARIPAPPDRLWGAGGYATGETGHQRFTQFPDVTSDDCWFDEQFASEEKRVVATPPALVRTARNTGALLSVLTRQRRGYRELSVAAQTRARGGGLLSSIHGPASAFDAGCYVILTLISRWRAARSRRRGDTTWERDGSSRGTSGKPSRDVRRSCEAQGVDRVAIAIARVEA